MIGSWWKRIAGSEPEADEPPSEQPAGTELPTLPEDQLDPIAETVARFGQSGGPTDQELVTLLHKAEGSLGEAQVLASFESLLALRAVPDEARRIAAGIMVERGERERALGVLDAVNEPAGLVLRADLLHESGKVAEAIAVIERVLARDIAYLGARDRHSRWGLQLGAPQPQVSTRGDVTVVVPPQRRSPFRILREVARGGSGVIYEARDDQLGRPVAFKVYHRASLDVDQMQRESRIAAQLAGPGVIRVLDVDFGEGWLALEWIAGGSMREMLAEGRDRELAPIGRWAVPLARAIARVHRAGYVHADLKPANVLFRAAGVPVLSDFGICVRDGDASVGGSAGYVSPERLASGRVVAGDDIYAFGRILEDVLARVSEAPGWRAVAERCMRPAAARPDIARLLAMCGG